MVGSPYGSEQTGGEARSCSVLGSPDREFVLFTLYPVEKVLSSSSERRRLWREVEIG